MPARAECPDLLEVGVAVRPLQGQTECGDRAVVRQWEGGALLAVIDGLGHGAEAAAAADRAASVLAELAGASVIAAARGCHYALTETRGVVMSIASFNRSDETMSWLSIGNVEGMLVRGNPEAEPREEVVLARSGIVGLRLPLLRATVTSMARGDKVVFATDGVRRDFKRRFSDHVPPQRLADSLLDENATGDDDALVLVARYLGP